MNIKTALAQAGALLQQKNITTARLDAEVLLAHVLECARYQLYVNADAKLPTGKRHQYQCLVQKRTTGYPVAYLVGHKEFMGLDFAVTPAVLIPRPDTELLVEKALHLASRHKVNSPLLVDVGTGSGAIAISLAHLLPSWRIIATDVSPAALLVAKQNAQTHNVGRRVSFLTGNLLEPLMSANKIKEAVAIITANLPYISTGDITGLSSEVKKEPFLALDGGEDGLELYRVLIPQADQLIKPGGYLLMEIGPGQGQKLLDLVAAPKWHSKLDKDLAGRERLVVAEKESFRF
ncbi:MAG: peptide chain release factor N(5)-glutamine methyltransferase [Desulfotomaculum sp.]|nr:peptide chain release factor N(5)-glutamine methyltransferase [Desulfotomaculum sp.]